MIDEDFAEMMRRMQASMHGGQQPASGQLARSYLGDVPLTTEAPTSILAQLGHAPQGRVMSDATPDSVSAGQQYAQNSPSFQISPRPNGQYAVIDIRTGQVRYVGTLDGARNAQGSLIHTSRR